MALAYTVNAGVKMCVRFRRQRDQRLTPAGVSERPAGRDRLSGPLSKNSEEDTNELRVRQHLQSRRYVRHGWRVHWMPELSSLHTDQICAPSAANFYRSKPEMRVCCGLGINLRLDGGFV